MATTSHEPAGGLRTPPLGSRAQSAAAFHPAGPDTKPGRLQGEIEAVNRANDPAEHEISFGPFRLLPTRRLLLEGNEPVHLGSRALDLLIALVERPGEVVSKSELIARVWPHVFVVEGNLKLNIAALRRALADGQAGNRYISTVSGRGYCFVAPVTRPVRPLSATARQLATEPLSNLPVPLTRVIGREEVISRISSQVTHHRLITLVGTGGIGKTSVAVATAERLANNYEHGVWFVDLTAIKDPGTLAGCNLLVSRPRRSCRGCARRVALPSEQQAHAPCARQLRACHRGRRCFRLPGAAGCSLRANTGDQP